MTNVMMSLVSLLNLGLGIASGVNVHEKKLKFYPKKYLIME